jgi:hypothetical protein
MKYLKLSVLALATVMAGTAAVKAQTADEIIKKHIEAVGGEKNWDKVTSMKLTGNMSVQGMQIPFVQTVVNKKALRMELTIMGTNNYQIVTEKEGWVYMPIQQQTAPTAMTPDQLKMGMTQTDLKATQYASRDKMGKIELLGKDTANSV